MARALHMTTDHGRIRRWTEERGGRPAVVRATGNGEDRPTLRIDLPEGTSEATLEEISWEEWFEAFDRRDLVFLYREAAAEGDASDFHQVVRRETAEETEGATWTE